MVEVVVEGVDEVGEGSGGREEDFVGVVVVGLRRGRGDEVERR